MSAAPERAPIDDPLVGQRLDRYEILYRLAQGGMGAVYIGRASGVAGFERLVAIKVLHPHLAHEEEFVTMFLDEARLAARIRHPNVVATLDVSQTRFGYFLVMEYIEGDHLGSLLHRAEVTGERIPTRIVLRIVLDALAGLSEAHRLTDRKGVALNLVHRDVSPQNILVGVDGGSRLTDFGIAKAEVRLSSTRDGQFKGKLSYTSPEQASHGQAEQRSDLFSMGIVLWEALAGRRLFRTDSNAATLQRILVDPIPRLSQVDPQLAAFDEVAAKALARPLDERFQTAQEMADAIERGAPAIGGIASPREITTWIQRLAGEKLRKESEAIQHAIDRQGGGSIRPPPPPAPMLATPSGVSPRLSDPDADTVAQKALSVSVSTGRHPPIAEEPRRSRAPWIITLAVLFLGAAGAALYFWNQGRAAPTVAATPAPDPRPAVGPTPTPDPPPIAEPTPTPERVATTDPTPPAAAPTVTTEDPPAPAKTKRRRPRRTRSGEDVLDNPYRQQ